MLQPYLNNENENNQSTGPGQPREWSSVTPNYTGQWQQAPRVTPTAPLRHEAPVLPPTVHYAGPSTSAAGDKQRPSRVRTGAIVLLTMVIVLVFGVGIFAGWQFGRSTTSVITPTGTNGLQSGLQSTSPQSTIPALSDNNIEAVREAVIARVRPSVVQVNVTVANGRQSGSGVIIDNRGYIVTNNHVVSGGQSFEVVLYDGTKLTGQVTGVDAADDLAVVKVNTSVKLTTVPLGDSSKLRVGQDVLAIGNPLGITQTVTNGIVSALGRSVSEGQGGATIPNAIQTDAPINPGNSGGALVDLQGNLVGIPTLTAIDPEFNTPANGVGFAIPSNRVNYVVPQIIQNGKVTHTGRAALGVRVADVDASVAAQDNLSVDHGALIASVVDGDAAANAGLQAGDVIVQIDSKQINDTASLGDALSQLQPGQTVAVKVYRGNQQLTINVTLGELQAG